MLIPTAPAPLPARVLERSEPMRSTWVGTVCAAGTARASAGRRHVRFGVTKATAGSWRRRAASAEVMVAV